MKKKWTRVLVCGLAFVFWASGSSVMATDKGKLFQVRFNLVPLLGGIALGDGGIYSFTTQFAPFDAISFGPTFAYSQFSATEGTDTFSVQSISYGGRINWYLGGGAISSGWMLSPWFTVLPITAKQTVVDPESAATLEISGSHTSLATGLSFGYQWVWGSGITLSMGLGFAYMDFPPNVTASGCAIISGFGEACETQVINVGDSTKDLPPILPDAEISIGFSF